MAVALGFFDSFQYLLRGQDVAKQRHWDRDKVVTRIAWIITRDCLWRKVRGNKAVWRRMLIAFNFNSPHGTPSLGRLVR